ncbi:chloramphenicol acetyltransferase [Flavobacterium noncentrifugens]|uniref:Chloramphenicol O-acetyltransferase type A n=1 Tax=Flavobacterium noncentrifugens TaxID=1128970 RepID=A0A1G8T8N5_9FLAO|nr:chloramphenicol acetyltransferase [Flavobacterium noncentrifugens]GEP50127.1 chloramphenicol acetyltransferase [Flavobacterium noncentrifugens]SDJ37801.1 chloramphenicol O-acetyltransferase type A [Flavobacterium noncentrifugens]
MKTLLNLDSWPRKEHFNFFRKFDDPFFGVVVEIDCTKAYEFSKADGISFFTYYLHKTLIAINTIEAFRYRIDNEQVFIYDRVDVSATISREDGSFGFSLIEFNSDFNVFRNSAITEIERVKNTSGLFTRSFEQDNLIHFSAIPWVNFTSLSHARSFTFPDSCPKISFGKMMVSKTGKRTMAMSVHVHHGLMDGFHVGQFVNCFQEEMNS